MSLERLRGLTESFRRQVAAAAPGPEAVRRPWRALPDGSARELLESMLLARHLDVAAHELRARNEGHYTICSSGHEANVVFGRLTRTTDPALVHYRSAAFQLERARQRPALDPVLDIALSLVASSDEPVSGGRHKVFGGVPLGIIPQTSTIASHLPRAVGLAVALERRAQLGLRGDAPADAIVLCSFGDASLNHGTATGALNAASWVVHQMLTLPLLFLCEDNGLGVSVRTPPGWVEERLRALPHLRVFGADAWDLPAAWRAADDAVRYVRLKRRPAVFHLRCERLLGHAGSDVDTVYRSRAEIAAAAARDPVLAAALGIVRAGLMTAGEVLALDGATAARVALDAERATARPKLASRAQVEAAIAPRPATAAAPAAAGPSVPAAAGRTPPGERLTLAQGINAALAETLECDPGALVFGEDVAKKGGVYGVTKGLFQRFGPARVFNTLLDETTILGMALGAGTLGLLPIPEIQYLAYLHNAEDQLRGEAATMAFFSNGGVRNPMIVRIQGLAYQKGFGGHFHNDNSLAVLRDVPGLVLAVPARADDALEIFRTAVDLARREGRVVVLVEPIALYHRRDLHEDGDGLWAAPAPSGSAPFGRARVYDDGAPDLVIATYGNGVALSLRAARRLQREHGLRARVLDLRFLAPLPLEDVLEHASAVGRLLVVDECRRSGNVSEALAAAVLDAGREIRFARVTAADCYVPLGEAADLVLVQEPEIVEAARRLCPAARRPPLPFRAASSGGDRAG